MELCPRCFKNELEQGFEKNQISKRDEKTKICGWCGNSESLVDFLVSRGERHKIRDDEVEMEKKFCEKVGVKCRLEAMN